jgi:hypothetical protein
MSEKHLPPCPTTPGNWKVWTPTWDGEGWRVIGPDGNERGRYLDANVMAEHLAMKMAEAVCLAEVLTAECATSKKLLALWQAFFAAQDEYIRLLTTGRMESDAADLAQYARDSAIEEARQLVKKLTEG